MRTFLEHQSVQNTCFVPWCWLKIRLWLEVIGSYSVVGTWVVLTLLPTKYSKTPSVFIIPKNGIAGVLRSWMILMVKQGCRFPCLWSKPMWGDHPRAFPTHTFWRSNSQKIYRKARPNDLWRISFWYHYSKPT